MKLQEREIAAAKTAAVHLGGIGSDRRAMFLLITVVLSFFLAPLLENDRVGEIVLLFNLYLTLMAATLELRERPVLFWSAIPIACASLALLLASHYYPSKHLRVANGIVLTAFLALVSVSMFIYLGRKGEITKGRLFVSVSLYFLIGLTWYAAYGVIDTLQPGSFADGGAVMTKGVPASVLMYFSLETLTTVGYGDVVAVRPLARMLATLEAAAGVLYVAITVARLVSAFRSQEK